MGHGFIHTKREKNRMDDSNLYTLLAITIALSAYLASIRLYAINKINNLPANSRRESIKRKIKENLFYIFLIDMPLVIGSFFIYLHLFWHHLFNIGKPTWFFTIGIWLITGAILLMILAHIGSWLKTVCEYIDIKFER